VRRQSAAQKGFAEVHRHISRKRKPGLIRKFVQSVPFSGALQKRETRVCARSEAFGSKSIDRRDSSAEQTEFEPSVPLRLIAFRRVS
jgi:hypothetical protein